MIRLVLLLLSAVQSLNAVWLTHEQAMSNSPFKLASLGWTVHFPNEDAVLIRGGGDNWRMWYKVDLISSDTLLHIDSSAFNYKGNDLYVGDLVFSSNAKKALIRTDTRKVWRHSHYSTYFIYDFLKNK